MASLLKGFLPIMASRRCDVRILLIAPSLLLCCCSGGPRNGDNGYNTNNLGNAISLVAVPVIIVVIITVPIAIYHNYHDDNTSHEPPPSTFVLPENELQELPNRISKLRNGMTESECLETLGLTPYISKMTVQGTGPMESQRCEIHLTPKIHLVLFRNAIIGNTLIIPPNVGIIDTSQ